MSGRAWAILPLLAASLALSGCYYDNQAYDTLANIRETRGDEVFTTTIDHFGEYTGGDDGPRSGYTTFSVAPSDAGLGIVIYLALWFDEQLTVTIFDALGKKVFSGSYGDENLDERTIAAALDGEPGTWTLEWQSSASLFKPQKIDILSSGDRQGKIITKSLIEERHHHFIRVTGSISGWGDEVSIRLIELTSGATVWSYSAEYTQDGMDIRIIEDPPQGKYRLEVDPGDWTGFMHLDVRGVFQGTG